MTKPTKLYPGIKLDLRWLPDWSSPWEKDRQSFYPIGFPEHRGGESTVIPVKEVAMMILMDTLTDKPDWHNKVFNETIVQKWRDEAGSMSEDGLYARIMQDKLDNGPDKPGSRIMTDAAFDYCIEELRAKAKYFLSSGLIPTLDGPANTIIKSDSYIDEALHQNINKACNMLREHQEDSIDWHPRSNDMVQDLIHPSMYHFVYDRSPFIQEEVVGVSNALDFIGQGDPVKGQTTPDDSGNRYELRYGIGSGQIRREYWSDKYQWLPANVAFGEDGSAKFTSYVNNLHPTKFTGIYITLEGLIDKALPAWDHCLQDYYGSVSGREKSRFAWIHDADDQDDENWLPEFDLEEFKNKDVELTHDELELLEINCYYDSENPIEVDEDEATHRSNEGLPPLTPNVNEDAMARAKWEKFRWAKLPDPEPFEAVDYVPKESLRERFKESGLQIIVKMASIELTPDKPEFSAGSWHLEGQMNEKIVATALYYFDSENVTPAHLSFRMQTSYYLDDDIRTGQGQYKYAEGVYGTLLNGAGRSAGGACIQSYGDVETREGRLLAFPNVFQHRVSSFRLQDPTKPGHRRFVALWLVDPNQRILSTANVPPQQRDWWVGDGEVPKGLMSVEEAREHRLKLMDERTTEKARSHWYSVRYNFCEH